MPFAPRPITIRYGDDGALGRAASAVGAQSSFDRQKALDMQFISGEMERRQQAAQFAQQNLLESRKLQMAGQSLMGQPASFQPGAVKGPLTTAIQAAKQATLAAANVNKSLSDEQRPVFEAAANDPNVDADQFERLVDDAARATSKQGADQSAIQAKKAFFDSVAPSLTQQERQAYEGMIHQPGVSLEQLRMTVNQAVSNRTVLPRTQLAYQVQGIDADIRAVREQMQNVERRMAKLKISPQTTPAALNPTFRDPEAGSTKGFGFKGNISDAYNPLDNQSLASGGNPEGMQAMTEYAKLQNALQELQAKRDNAMRQAQSLGAPPQQAAPAQGVQGLSDEELLRQLQG